MVPVPVHTQYFLSSLYSRKFNGNDKKVKVFYELKDMLFLIIKDGLEVVTEFNINVDIQKKVQCCHFY